MMTEVPDPTAADFLHMPAYERVARFALVDTPALRRTLSDRDVASILGSLCLAYAMEERYDEAFAAGLRAQRIARGRATDDPALLGHVLLNLGVAHSQAGDLEKGLAAYLESWTHARRGGDEGTLFKAGANALLALEAGRRTGEAEFAFLQECRAVFEAADRQPESARASRLLGEALLDRGQVADAIAVLDRVLVLTESLGGARSMRRETTRLLREADRRIGDPADAPPLGPGVLREVGALVDDGVESALRGIVPRTRTCFSRALALLERRARPRERLLAAFLLLVGAQLAFHEDDELATIELMKRAGQEVELIKPSLAEWVKTHAFHLDLGALSTLARNAAVSARERGSGA
ncbi:hypothetical protein [Streptomyces sp. NPDC008240]|uniref:hypothetical protein n=1 Tax=Streptomyces sp. NPDC008240 TaxID=3364822 RepID=UPI0036E52B85